MGVRVLGYTADADTYCVPCTRALYGRKDVMDGELTLDGAIDREGNELYPIFSTDDWGRRVCCGSCGDDLGLWSTELW